MTSYKVMENFKKVLESTLKNVRFETKENCSKNPKIVLGYLEPLKVDDDEADDFPYVLVRYMNGEGSEDESEVNLKLIFGIYSQDAKGWVDVLHMIEVVKQMLLKTRVFDFYTLEYPLKDSIPEEQPYPYFYGFLDIRLKIPHIEIEGDEEPWPA